jgi:beta-lactam-binding protein with PASTA domain
VLKQSARRGDRIPTGRTITLTVSTGPADVLINEADYVGRPSADVSRELTAKHLFVQLKPGPATAPAGTVTAVDPSGPVREGATVTLTVASAPGPPGKEHGPGKPPKHHDH